MNIKNNHILNINIIREVEKLSRSLGFDLFGITKPVLDKNDYEYLKKFIDEKQYANMQWFSNYKEIRLYPDRILENASSVFVFGHFYKDPDYEPIVNNAKVKISRYAIGKDYHKILKKKLKSIEIFLKEKYPEIKTRITVDSAPVPEKILAKYAGIGWIGKNTNIIHPHYGSYFFISCIFTDYKLPEEWIESRIADHCKGCSLCIQHCPTQALEPYKLNVEKCLSYWNIESKMVMIEDIVKKSKGWVFGCDICQEVCPYNRKKDVLKLKTGEENFKIRQEIKKIIQELPTKEEWENIKNSPLKRVSYEIFSTNYKNILKYAVS